MKNYLNKTKNINPYVLSDIKGVKIYSKIIPLFINPIILKEIELEKKNKSNLNSSSSFLRTVPSGEKNTNTFFIHKLAEHSVLTEATSFSSNSLKKERSIPTNLQSVGVGGIDTLSLLLKGFSIYNFNLNKYLKEKKVSSTSSLSSLTYFNSSNLSSMPLSLSSLPILERERRNGKKEKGLIELKEENKTPYFKTGEQKDKQLYLIGKKLDLIKHFTQSIKSNSFISQSTGPSSTSLPITKVEVLNNSEVNYIKEEKQNIRPYDIESKSIINLHLKEMSRFNMNRKGVFIHYSEFMGYHFNKQNNKFFSFVERKKNLYKLLAASFKSMYCLISKPVFISTPDKVIIQLFYFLFIPNILKLKKFYKHNYSLYSSLTKNNKNIVRLRKRKNLKKQYSKFRKIKLNVRVKLRKLSNMALTKVFSNKFKLLCISLNKLFKKPVELDLIRLHYPYKDSNILVNLLGIMINKIKLRIIFRKLFEKAVIKNKYILNNKKVNIIPAFLSGLSIRVGGRLLTHKLVPRKTVKSIRRGATAHGKINFKDVATYTNKNKRGAFTITVKSGQNFLST